MMLSDVPLKSLPLAHAGRATLSVRTQANGKLLHRFFNHGGML